MSDLRDGELLVKVQQLAEAISILAYSGSSVFGTTDAKKAILLAQQAAEPLTAEEADTDD